MTTTPEAIARAVASSRPAPDPTRCPFLKEEALRDRTAVQRYMDVAGVLMVALSPEGRVTHVNEVTCERLGRPKEEIVERDWFAQFLPGRIQAPARAVFEALLDGAPEASEPVENAIRDQDGREVHILWHNATLRDDEGEATGVVAFGTDVTARREARRALRKARDLLAMATEASRLGWGVWDFAAGQFCWDVRGREIAGLPAEASVEEQEAWTEHIHPDDRPRVEARLEACRAEGGAFDLEYRIVRPGGEVRRIHGTGAFELGPDGTATHGTGFVRDVTERYRTQAALEESERRFRSLFEASPDAVFVEALDGTVLDVNPAACRLHRTRREVLQGQHLRDLVPPEQRESIMRDFQRLARGAVDRLEAYSWTVNEHAVPVEIRAGRFVYDGQEAVLLIVRDVSERRALEREVLRISEEERQRIGQDIHDALASRFSGMALLSRGLAGQLRRGEAVEAEALDELAELAREGGEEALALARGLNPVNLDREGLQSALAELAHATERLSGLPCTLHVDEALPPLQTEAATQIYRVAQEAASNAVKHADGASQLAFHLRREDDRLVLAVTDDGPGLPPDARESTHDEASGDGMGLHVMPYRARMVGGTLSIDTGAGEGTTVTCSAPLSSVRRRRG